MPGVIGVTMKAAATSVRPRWMPASRSLRAILPPAQPAARAAPTLAAPIPAMAAAPSAEVVSIPSERSSPPAWIGPQTSVTKGGKFLVTKPSWKPLHAAAAAISTKDGSRIAARSASPGAAPLGRAGRPGAPSRGSARSAASASPASPRKAPSQPKPAISHPASGGPAI